MFRGTTLRNIVFLRFPELPMVSCAITSFGN